jgi:UDP-arabinose 4-epimerase
MRLKAADMHILVTGGAGYIGSHACKALAEAGFHPVVVDDLRQGHAWAVRWGPLVQGNFGDRNLLSRTFQQYPIKAVVHFAASAYVGESMRVPDLYFQNNVVNTVSLLDGMRENGVKHIVFSSSCATYGQPRQVPISEDHPQSPVNPYGESKLMVEKLLYWYGQAYDLSWAALRYFNAGGADPDGQLGEVHEPEPHLLPTVLAAAQGSIPHLEVFGTDYDTPDGTAVRDYIHVTDLAAAHVLALRYLLNGQTSAAFNLGTGSGYSVRDVVSTVERVTGRDVPVVERPRRSGDPAKLVADPRKATSILGWRPRYSDLQTVIETAWRWQVASGRQPEAAHRSLSAEPHGMAASAD